VRHQFQGLAVLALALALTAGALGGLHAAVPRPPRALEVAVLVVANLAATVLRFLLLRDWVFRPPRRPDRTPGSHPHDTVRPTRSTP